MSVKAVQTLAVLCVAGMLSGVQGADTRVNLLKEGKFKPVYMHGMVTAARGWSMHDNARVYSISKKRQYISGEECFQLKYADGTFSILFKKPLNPCYRHGEILLSSRIGSAMPPAERYTLTGRLKFKNGNLELRKSGRKFAASDEWQDFKITLSKPESSFMLRPEEGAEYHFAEAFLYAEYPKIGGSIALPDGGKLEKFLLPENASYELRLGVALWRGWLWRLTGVALPIETVGRIDGPVKGAFVAMQGREKPGRWSLKVDQNGVFLRYGSEHEVECAVFDYLRRSLGCAFYRDDLQKIPEQGSVKLLPALEFSARPHFSCFNTCRPICTMQGGCDYNLLYTRNDVDYYHLPSSKQDHVFNVLVPQERYFYTHPEYFMDDGSGKRRIRENPHYTQHCLSNPEFMELLLKNSVEYAKAQNGPLRLVISPGDAKVHCLCPRCVKFNNGTASSSNVSYEFHDRLARRIAEVRPDMMVEMGAYASRVRPPDHIKSLSGNTVLHYCMAENFPCTLHVNCEINRGFYSEVLKLRKLVGDDPEKMSFMFYWDLRPLYMVKLMRELNKYGSDCAFFWYYRSFHPAIPFLLGRWNLGEDPEKLLREYETASYGKGAPFVHRAFEATEEFASNYRHSPQDLKSGASFRIWPDKFGNAESVMGRPAFDRIHALFAKALEAAGNDRDARRNIYRDWLFFLAEDLNKYRAPSCRTDGELREFAKRLGIVVKAGREFPGHFKNLMFRVPAREFLSGVTGVDIPETVKNWAKEPQLDKVIRDPEKYLERGGEHFMGSGIYFTPLFFKSSFEDTLDTRPEVRISNYRRDNQLLQPTQEMTLEIPWNRPVKQPLMLSIEGVVQKAGTYPISVAMNGVEIYRGPAPFAADRWTRMGLSIPGKTLKNGDNTLRIKNLSSTAGWMAISEIYVIDVSGDFRKFANGENALWRAQLETGRKSGIVKNGGGKVLMIGNADGEARLGYFAHVHTFPKIAVFPGGRVRLRVRASGHGQLTLRLCRYSPYELDPDGVQKLKPSGYLKHIGYQGMLKSKVFKLRERPRTYSFDFKIPKKVGLVFPDLAVANGEAEITEVAMEILPAKPAPKRK